ncbi:MAG: hypothetical protein JXQ29_12475 [Planctomycetes bacterium]|nr:hypothetical protein [Planctomycetota bacterium]
MIDRTATLAAAVGDDVALVSALGAALPGLRRTAGGWQLPGPPPHGRLIRMRRDGDWLTLAMAAFTSHCGPAAARDPGLLLRRNHHLPAGVRLALVPGRRRPELRAEVPLVRECARRSDLAHAHAALLAAARCLAEPPDDAGAPPDGPPAPDVAERIREAGWPHDVRADGTLAVPLATAPQTGPVLVAVVHGTAANGVRIAVELGRVALADAVAHEALARFLLGVNGRVRLVRAAAVATEAGEDIACLEVGFENPPEADELAAAFAACAAAGRLAAAEVECLCHEHIARVFLAIQARGRQRVE